MSKKRTNQYWIERSNQLLASMHQQSTPYVHEINKYYDKALKDLQKDINKIFQVYANNHNLTRSEAKRLLNTKISTREIEHLRREISQIANAELKKSLLAKLNANAYSARISRIEALKQSIQVHYSKVSDKQLTLSKAAYINTIRESYYMTAFNLQKGIDIGFHIAQIPNETIKAILNTNWSGKLYSQRVWGNSQHTIDSIAETLTSGFISGKSVPRMVKEIQELTQYGKYAAERLIRTECTFFSNQGAMESYRECEIEKYVFVATLDNRTSKQCQKHDRKVYEVAKAMPGKNLPPLHTWCRSTTRAYLGEKYMRNIKRRARDPVTGKTYLVGNMNYKEWYNRYVKGSSEM